MSEPFMPVLVYFALKAKLALKPVLGFTTVPPPVTKPKEGS